MHWKIMVALTLGFVGVATAAEPPRSYQDAEAIWIRTRDKIEYQAYAAEFAQFNNALRLDERGDCYSLTGGTVNLMLLISGARDDGFAVVEGVFYDANNAKARCFERSFSGIRTKAPPFLPFVLQLRMD
jgi:hypothetical protein